MPIDKFRRIQKNFSIGELYPDIKHKCACGCGKPLKGRRKRWANDICRKKAVNHYFVIYGDVSVIRTELRNRDRTQDGKLLCVGCGVNVVFEKWEADHIIEVRHGGGGCELDNFQIMCVKCHKRKTKRNYAKAEKTLDLFGDPEQL